MCEARLVRSPRRWKDDPDAAQSDNDDEDTADRPVAGQGWVIPTDIKLDGETLIYRGGIGRTTFVREPDRRLLVEFLDLSSASAKRILTFARTWGVLNLCKCDLPASHNAPEPGIGPRGSKHCWPGGSA